MSHVLCFFRRPLLFKYSSRKIGLKRGRDGKKKMTHDSINIFFKLLLKNLL